MDGSIFFLDGGRSDVLFKILIVQIARDIEKSDHSFVVDATLHFLHGLLGLFFRLVFNEHVTCVSANVLLVLVDKPVVDNCAELREPLQEIFFVLLPLLLIDLACHVWSDCVGGSN